MAGVRKDRGVVPTPGPAVGYAVTVDIAPGRQVTFQCFFDQDEPDEAANRRLDRVMSLADRQRAKYEIPELVAERQKLTDELDQHDEDLATAELNHTKAQASIDVQVAELVRLKNEEREKGYDAHVKNGRQGPYVPKGHVAAQIVRIEADIAAAAGTKAKNDAERQNYLDNLDISMKRKRARIDLLNEKIAGLEKAAA